jgi:anti-sigma B factor antagonist
MKFEEAKTGNILVLTVKANRVAADVVAGFKQGLADYVVQGNQKIVLDLSEVSFIDSSALGALISVLKLVGGSGELVLCSTQHAVASMFKLTRMNKVFRIFDNRDDAISALS